MKASTRTIGVPPEEFEIAITDDGGRVFKILGGLSYSAAPSIVSRIVLDRWTVPDEPMREVERVEVRAALIAELDRVFSASWREA